LAELQASKAALEAELELQRQLYQLELERAELETAANLAPVNKGQLIEDRADAKSPTGVENSLIRTPE
jgi:hypothetical protein